MVPVLTAHTDCFDFSTLTDTIVKLTSNLLHRASPGSSPTFPSINDKLANNNVYSLIRSFLISTDSINSKNVRSVIYYSAFQYKIPNHMVRDCVFVPG